jgi:hypothetical protein
VLCGSIRPNADTDQGSSKTSPDYRELKNYKFLTASYRVRRLAFTSGIDIFCLIRISTWIRIQVWNWMQILIRNTACSFSQPTLKFTTVPLPSVAQCSSFLIHCHSKLEVGEPTNCEIRQGSPVPSSESNCWLGPLTLYG